MTEIIQGEHYGELQRFVDRIFQDLPEDDELTRLDILSFGEVYDLPADLMDGAVEEALARIEHASFQLVLDGLCEESIMNFGLGRHENRIVIAETSFPLGLNADAFFIAFPERFDEALQVFVRLSEGGECVAWNDAIGAQEFNLAEGVVCLCV